MINLYKNKPLRELEQRLFKEQLAEPAQLMDNAGQVVFETFLNYWPKVKSIAVFCGKGNNGGDGWVLARLAQKAGLKVALYATINQIEDYNNEAFAAASKAIAAGVNWQVYDAKQAINLDKVDVIIDALLGSGLTGEVKAPYCDIITMINGTDIPVLSIDLPSGLAADTGTVLGNAIQADVTVTFTALKQGLLTNQASAYCGALVCKEIGIPANELSALTPSAYQLQYSDIKTYLPKRSRSSYKSDYGHVLVIGGDYGMGGAVRMAAEAALRTGSGLVSVATRPEHVSIVNNSRPEIMCHQIMSDQNLEPLLKKATVMVIGPGFGKSDWAKSLFSKALTYDIPKVIDADALNILAENPLKNSNWILTPHPGEAGRLLHTNSMTVQKDRFAAAIQLQSLYQGIIVLKGAGTIIQGPDSIPLICAAGNPGMATAGMGDVLSGIIGGLLAQGLNLKSAAETGVMIHALAADRAAEQGGERGLLATDLLGYLREFVNPS